MPLACSIAWYDKQDFPLEGSTISHTCATQLLAQGVHLRVVMEILGHSQVSLTMNAYSHVALTFQKEVARRMDEPLS